MVAVIKVDGKIMRENDGEVYIPFGSEYSILLKNLSNKRALVSITIDGQDVLNGSKLIIQPNNSIELKRFLENLDHGNRFKFIQKTDKIKNHRGDRADDGIIRIEYWFESSPPIATNINYPKVIYSSLEWNNNTSAVNSHIISNSHLNNTICSYNCNNSITVPSINHNEVKLDDGITVKGSECNQKFNLGVIGSLELTSNVIIIQLKGYIDNKIVESPITVQTKLKCLTCGTLNKSTHKYCKECGTYLF